MATSEPLRLYILPIRCNPAPMPLSQDIQQLVSKFASDVEALVRTAAVSAVQDVLGGAVVPSVAIAAKPARKRATAAAKPAPKAKPAGARPAVARATRARRSAEDIESTATKIVDYVRSNPGSKAEQIKAALKLPSNQWGKPLAVALESRRIASSGDRRATTYRVPGGAVPPIKRAAK